LNARLKATPKPIKHLKILLFPYGAALAASLQAAQSHQIPVDAETEDEAALRLFVDLSSDNDLARSLARSGSYGLFKPRSHNRLGQMLRAYYFVAQIL
jgi:hypothetical protein